MEEVHSHREILPGGLPAAIPLELSPSRREPASAQYDLSRFLEDFRSGKEPQTTQWIRLASLVASQSFSCDIVVRALRANEKSVTGKAPLDRLGESLARKIGARYSPGRLKRDGEGFIFDSSSLKPDVRVLIVGDRETPPETFAQIVAAITKSCPGATARSFSLQWLEEHFRSTPFDHRYFLTSASPLSVLSKESNPHKPKREPYLMPAEHAPSPEARTGAILKLPQPAVKETPPEPPVVPPAPPEPEVQVAAHEEAAAGPLPEPHPATPAPPMTKKPASIHRPPVRTGARKPATASVVTAISLIAMLVIGLGFVVFSRLFSAKEEPNYARAFIPEPALTAPEVPAAVAAIAPPAAVAERQKGPKGIVTVPSAGLRAAPSLSAKGIPTTLKGNERVTILKRRVSTSGPDWIQVETKSGKVGWVWASVVREIRR